MPLKLFNKGDVDAVSNPKPPARRLSKPRTISTSSTGVPKQNSDSPQSAHNSLVLEDDAVIETSGGSFRSRASTRDRLRSQLFGEKFHERKTSQNYTNEEHAEDKQRRGWIMENPSSRLSLPPRDLTASPGLSSPAGSKISLSLDTEIDLPKAISIIQELKKTASPEDIVLLHKALLPVKDEGSPISVHSDESPPFPTQPMDRTMRRRSMQQAPGVATRPSPRPVPSMPPSETKLSRALTQPSQRNQENRSLSLPSRISPQRRDTLASSRTPMAYDRTDQTRATTPSSETDFGCLSPPGELRVTNGAASPDSMRSSRKLQQIQKAELHAHHKRHSTHHSRGGTLNTSSLQQVMHHEDDTTPETSEASRHHARQLRDEGYFTASEYAASSKEGTPYTEEENKPIRPRVRRRSSFSRQHRENMRDKPQPGHNTGEEDGNNRLSSQPFWTNGPSAEDYKRDIGSNPYLLSDDSPTLPPEASPLIGMTEGSNTNVTHQRQLSRNPEEALRQLNGSHDDATENRIKYSMQAQENEKYQTIPIVHSSFDRHVGERVTEVEHQNINRQGPRKPESSIKKDGSYDSGVSLVLQTNQGMKSKDSNPEAPRPVEGGTFGYSLPPVYLRPDFGSPFDHAPPHEGGVAGENSDKSVKGYEVTVSSVPQVVPSKSLSSLRLKPSTWFSRNNSTSNLPQNASKQTLPVVNEPNEEPRRSRKLQKLRRKSVPFATPSEENVSRRSTSKDDKPTLESHENVATHATRFPTMSIVPEHEPTEHAKSLHEWYDSSAPTSEERTNHFNNENENFPVQGEGYSLHSEEGSGRIIIIDESIGGDVAPRRRKSIFGRRKSSAGRSTKHDASDRSLRKKARKADAEKDGSESDGDGAEQDFGTVAESLGGSPYDAAMSGQHVQKAAWNSGSGAVNTSFPSHSHQAQQLMGQAMQPAGVLHPHQISNAHVRRPKSLVSMNEQQASEYARLRSRDRAEMLGKPKPFDPRDVPVSSGPARPKSATNTVIQKIRPQSMYETPPTAPPVPALPHMAALENAGAAASAEGKAHSKIKSLERKTSQETITALPRYSEEKSHPLGLPIQKPPQNSQSAHENQQRLRKERKKSAMRDRSREHSELPSPIKEEEGSPKSGNYESQTYPGKAPRRKSLGAIRGSSGQTPNTAVARKSYEDVVPRESPTEVLEARLNSPASQEIKYHTASQEEANVQLSKEAEQGLKAYPEFAHLLDARASAKSKTPERMPEYQSSNTSIDTVIGPTTAPSVSSAARAAYSKLSPLNPSSPSPPKTEDKTLPLPRRHIHPSARPRQTTTPSNQPTAPPTAIATAESRPEVSTGPPAPPHHHQHLTTSSATTPPHQHTHPRSADPRPTSTTITTSTTTTTTGSVDTFSALSSSSSSTTGPSGAHPELLHRYAGGLRYGWERGSGLGGSAGTRGAGDRASWKGIGDRLSWGIDLGDVPVFVTEQ
ncbi:MAG: hypothetical protein M1822_003236 [Bathelium mastoideum]|nr:MAG: hypothetical protein M1822_003236 [Bathelium mastoideum]